MIPSPTTKRPGPGNGTGICACGCGESTPLATRNRVERGIVSGFPLKHRSGHHAARPTRPARDGMKECARCHRTKPVAEFQSAARSSDGFKPYCTPCRRTIERNRVNRNREAERARARARRLARYGLNEKSYAALVAQHDGSCHLCGSADVRQAGCSTMHTDHDHATGQVRGLLCRPCNVGLGMFRDDPALLRRAAAYLDGEH